MKSWLPENPNYAGHRTSKFRLSPTRLFRLEEWIVNSFWHRTFQTALAFILLLAAATVLAQTPKPTEAPREDLTIDPGTIMQPWKGDLDQMVERRSESREVAHFYS